MEAGLFTANNVWMMISTALVFFMHLGFSFLEIGLTRQKNTINIVKEQERFFQRTHHHLILKELSSNKVYFPKDTYWSNVKDYLAENNFINQASIEFSNTRLTGPKLVNINNIMIS